MDGYVRSNWCKQASSAHRNRSINPPFFRNPPARDFLSNGKKAQVNGLTGATCLLSVRASLGALLCISW